jgi:hypothetical protein
MKRLVLSAAVVLLALPATALALSFESFGNAPEAKRPGWAEGLLDLVNLPGRVYSLYGGLDETPTFYYQGDGSARREAIRKLGAVHAAARRLILLPGRGRTFSFDRRPIDFDWQLLLVTGSPVEMTVYVNALTPRGRIDRVKAQKWIAQLDDDSFEVRQAASRELDGLGAAARPLLRDALKARPSPEARRRINRLLAKWRTFDACDLEVSDAVTVVTGGELLRAHLKDLSGDKEMSAMYGLVELAAYSDRVVPALTARLDKGKSVHVRCAAAHCLGGAGAAARTALPALKVGLRDPDANVRGACDRAVERIERDRSEQGWAQEVKKRIAILKDLDEWKKARGK